MTVSRYILLVVVALSPLSAFGQEVLVPRQALIDGPSYGIPPSPSDPGGDTAGSSGVDPGNGQFAAPQFDPTRPSQWNPGQPDAASSAFRRGPTRQYSTPIWESTTKGSHYGILGPVAKPGVYSHQKEHIPLIELVKLAGGATPQSSGSVRIVRQGRGGMQTFLSPESQYEAMNGDIILLETNRFGSRLGSFKPTVGDRQGLSSTAKAENPAQPDLPPPAYLAFVNLLPRPVIVPVPSDQATLVTVMKWLRQDSQQPPVVRILPPNPLLRQNSVRSADPQLLESGTVLVFDPATVQRDRLPAFPPVLGTTGESGTPQPNAGSVVTPSRSDPLPPGQIQAPAPKAGPAGPRVGPPAKSARDTTPPTALNVPARNVTSPNAIQVPSGLQHARQSFGNRGPANAVPIPAEAGVRNHGPLLMMPQTQGPSHSPATSGDSNVRQTAPPRRLNVETDTNTTAAHHEGLPMGWQSRPQARTNTGIPEVAEPGVIPANGELGGFEHEFAGPALELPNPIPKLLPPETATLPQLIPAPLKQPKTTVLPSTLSMQVVWFSLGSMLLLVVGLWCLSRWDGPRPVRAALAAAKVAPAPSNIHQDSQAGHVRLRFLKQKATPTSEAPLPVAPVVPQTSPPERAAPSEPVPISAPKRAISHQEQALRDHFRQARNPQHSVEAKPEVQASPVPSKSLPAESLLVALQKAASVPKVLAQVPKVSKPVQPADDSTASRRDVLDRVLWAHRQR